MAVERRHQRGFRSNHITYSGQNVPIAILDMLRHCCAMQLEKDAIDFPRVAQSGHKLLFCPFVRIPGDGSANAWHDKRQRDNLPAVLLSAGEKTGNGALAALAHFEQGFSGQSSALKKVQGEWLSCERITGDKISANSDTHKRFLLI